jgi:hypothetical protein
MNARRANTALERFALHHEPRRRRLRPGASWRSPAASDAALGNLATAVGRADVLRTSPHAARPRRRREARRATRRERLADALVMLPPALVQCRAAHPDAWHEKVRATPRHPGLTALPDSCYMWRRGGALERIREAQGAGKGGR